MKSNIITDSNDNLVLNIDPEDSDHLTLATANTYVDKNIVINIPLTTKANIESPAFTGVPTAPTPPIGDKTSNIATTEYVQKEFDRTVRWDNAEEGTTMAVTSNMVVLTEDEYNKLTVKIPNTFYFIYDDIGEAAVSYDL